MLPDILQRKRDGGTIRIWVAGCSTGEEAYSLVIATLEIIADAPDIWIQLFGSDVSEAAIEKARSGVYSDAAVRGVSAERLARFFTKLEGAATRSMHRDSWQQAKCSQP